MSWFSLLPPSVYDESDPFFMELPPELIVIVLRKLDPESLLNVCRASRSVLKMVKGDTVLRRTLTDFIGERKRRQKELWDNPRLALTVTWGREVTPFSGANVSVKTVSRVPVVEPENFDDVEEVLKVKRKRRTNVSKTRVSKTSRCIRL